MDYLGDKLTVAQSHMSQWMGTVRRSLQEALNLVNTAVSQDRSGSGEHSSRAPLKRTSSFRHFASRSRESFRRFSVRSQQRFQSLRKRSTLSTSSDIQDLDRVKQCFVTSTEKARDIDPLCTCDDKEEYGTYEERCYSTSEDTEPSSKYNEPKDYEDTIPVLPCKDHTADAVVYPRSTSLSSEVTPASEQPGSLQEPRSISRGLSSCELELTDDTDSSQSTGLVTQDDQAPQGFSFLEPVTTLDSCAQKSRVQLGRKTFRRAPTKHRKGGLGDQTDGIDQFSERKMDPCIYRDSTEPRPLEQEDLTTEEDKECEKPQVLPYQKVAMFPGMDPAVLKASLRKSRPEVEAPNELNSKSSKPHPQQGFRVLPPTTGKGEKSNAAVPSWLQELKSKKRLSQIQPSSED